MSGSWEIVEVGDMIDQVMARPVLAPAFGWRSIDVNERLGRFTDYLTGQGVEVEADGSDDESLPAYGDGRL